MKLPNFADKRGRVFPSGGSRPPGAIPPPKTAEERGGISPRLLLAIALVLLPLVLLAQAPTWWYQDYAGAGTAPVRTSGTNDYAAVNQGQLKNLATAAVAHLDASLPEPGAGDALHTLVYGWTTATNANDYAAVNLGQLKAVAKPFYDRLKEVGCIAQAPWAGREASANDYAMANIGQAKNLFSFDLTAYSWTSDTLPGWWKQSFFGTTPVADDGDEDQDGISNLEEYHNGTNPTDYYNGVPPTLSILSGGDQRAAPGTVLAVPLSVSVNGGVENAPVTFTVASGNALLSSTNDGTLAPSASVNLRSVNTYTNASGGEQHVAQVYIYLPANASDLSTIRATASSATRTISLTTTAATTDPTLTAPTEFTATPTSPTTADLAWTPSDASKPTTIQGSYDGGATWFTVGAVAAGASSVTITGMAPDVSVSFRVITGNCTGSAPTTETTLGMPSQQGADSPSGGGGSPSSPPTTAQPLSQPVLMVEQSSYGGWKWGSPGFIQWDHTRYLSWTRTMTFEATSPEDTTDGTWTGTTTWTTVGTWTFETTGNPFTQYAPMDWVIVSDASAFGTWTEGGTGIGVQTLANEYTTEMLYANVESSVPEFTNNFTPYTTGTSNTALIYKAVSEFSYDLTKLQYKFKVNSDPNGFVIWDVQFTPDNGDPVQHDIHTEATNGRTETSVYYVDPTTDPNLNLERKSGIYEVLLLRVEPTCPVIYMFSGHDSDVVELSIGGGSSLTYEWKLKDSAGAQGKFYGAGATWGATGTNAMAPFRAGKDGPADITGHARAQASGSNTIQLLINRKIVWEKPLEVLFINNRASWGANPAGKLDAMSGIQAITVHHAADLNNNTSAVAVQRYQESHQVERHWADIGYHFVMGKDGLVYEGRVLERGDGTYNKGAQVPGVSSEGISNNVKAGVGVCIQGSYSVEDFPDSRKLALEKLLTALKRRYSPSGTLVGGKIETITHHNALVSKDCPGRNIEVKMEIIKSNVETNLK